MSVLWTGIFIGFLGGASIATAVLGFRYEGLLQALKEIREDPELSPNVRNILADALDVGGDNANP